MEKFEAQFMANLMEQDSYFTQYALASDFETYFPNSFDEQRFKKVFWEFEKSSQLVALDAEFDVIQDLSLEHHEHGPIEVKDVDFTGADIYYAMGPACVVSFYENLSEISQAAAEGGLSETLRLTSLMPTDSSAWTGIPKALKYDQKVQAQAVELLEDARRKLSTMSLSNADHKTASGYVECALILMNLPEPELSLTQHFVRRLLTIVGVVGVFADLKEIFS